MALNPVQLVLLLNGILHRLQFSSPNQILQFGVDLLRDQTNHSEENVLLSPLSIAISLAMLQSGSSGSTLNQLNQMLPFLQDMEIKNMNVVNANVSNQSWIEPEYAVLNRSHRSANFELHPLNQSHVYELWPEVTNENENINLPKSESDLIEIESNETKAKLANQTLWLVNQVLIDSQIKLGPTYEQMLQSKFGANVLHLEQNPVDQLKKLNIWTQNVTEGRLKSLFSKIPKAGNSQLSLINALVLDAFWAKPFSKLLTRQRYFYESTNRRVKCDFLTAEQRFPNLVMSTHLLLSLPYQDLKNEFGSPSKSSIMQLLLVLPQKNVSLSDALETISSPLLLQQQLNQLKTDWIDLRLPRFRLQTSFDLRPTLKRLGLTKVFDSAASNFSRMCEDPSNTYNQSDGISVNWSNSCHELKVDELQHSAQLVVDEEGTRASAITRIQISPRGLRQSIEFHANRPFAFLLMYEQLPLFVGVFNQVPTD